MLSSQNPLTSLLFYSQVRTPKLKYSLHDFWRVAQLSFDGCIIHIESPSSSIPLLRILRSRKWSVRRSLFFICLIKLGKETLDSFSFWEEWIKNFVRKLPKNKCERKSELFIQLQKKSWIKLKLFGAIFYMFSN